MLSTIDDVETADWLTLTDGEEVLDKKNPHWIEYLLPGTASLVLVLSWLVVGLTVSYIPVWFALVGVVAGGAILLFAHLRRITTIYVVTTKEVYKRYGVLSEDYDQIRIDRIQNTSVDLMFWERIIEYGDITVFTSGSGGADMRVSNIPAPKETNQLLNELMDEVSSSPDADAEDVSEEETDPAAGFSDPSEYRGIH